MQRRSCIRLRLPSGKPYRWEFGRRGVELAVDVPERLSLDHPELMTDAAAAGLGLAYLPDRVARPLVERGAPVLVLEDWCPPNPGLMLHYPGHRHGPSALRVFIDVLKVTG